MKLKGDWLPSESAKSKVMDNPSSPISADPIRQPNKPLRRFLQFLARGLLGMLTDMDVEGERISRNPGR